MIHQIEIDEIKPFLDRESPKEGFKSLVNSITKHGVLMPITVRAIIKRKSTKKSRKSRKTVWMYELIKGHRRLRAAKEAGLSLIPAFLSISDNVARVHEFFIENDQRKRFTPYELGILMNADRGVLSLSEIADKYCLSPHTVREYLTTIDRASPDLLSNLKTGRLNMYDARAISPLETSEQRVVIKEVLKKNLKGRDIHDTVRALKESKSTGDKITKKMIAAQTVGLGKMLNDKKDEYNSLASRYRMSVLGLKDALAVPAFKKLAKKANIDFSYFVEDK